MAASLRVAYFLRIYGQSPPDRVRVSYDADANFDVVVGHYEADLHNAAIAGVIFAEAGNGHRDDLRDDLW